jgi:hypothetical protein
MSSKWELLHPVTAPLLLAGKVSATASAQHSSLVGAHLGFVCFMHVHPELLPYLSYQGLLVPLLQDTNRE